MRTIPFFLSRIALATLLLLFCVAACKKKADDIIIVIDDVIMLNRPAVGLEGVTCANFVNSRSAGVAPSDSLRVEWSEGKSLPNDSIQIIRFEILRDTGSLVQFTMTIRPLSNKPSEIQCMKGFGCDGLPWESFPWISPAGDLLDHTIHKFRVIPRGKNRLSIENYNGAGNLIVKVNPPI
jgi:hypothetical protein